MIDVKISRPLVMDGAITGDRVVIDDIVQLQRGLPLQVAQEQDQFLPAPGTGEGIAPIRLLVDPIVVITEIEDGLPLPLQTIRRGQIIAFPKPGGFNRDEVQGRFALGINRPSGRDRVVEVKGGDIAFLHLPPIMEEGRPPIVDRNNVTGVLVG